MCGIAGVINEDKEVVYGSVLRMGHAMMHRGMDSTGETVDRFGRTNIGLGHRRLAILDLSPLGQQPMSSEDGLHRIVFNGTIYNFQRLRRELENEGDAFKSHSDTEVLLLGLRRHGVEFLRRIQGMYAFAYLNRENHSLILARDPAGIKPLYYYESDMTLVFASEVRALLASGATTATISQSAVANFFAYGAVAQPTSIFSGIYSVKPGSWREYRATDTSVRLHREHVWWTPPEVDFKTDISDAILHTRDLLHSAVRDHLIADVPVGVFLSAGVDSTILASVAHAYSEEVRGFTVTLDDEPDMDESEIAGATAARIGMEHVPIRVSKHDALDATIEWFGSVDQPSIDGLNTFLISKAVRNYGIKVALSGLGADELFGGYPSFQQVPKIARLAHHLRWIPSSVRRKLVQLATLQQPQQVSEKLQDMFAIEPRIGKLATMRLRLMSNRELASLGLNFELLGLNECGLPDASMDWQPRDGSSPGWAVSIAETRYYQGDVLLRDSDVNSMVHSLELRVPFLDQRLLDWIHTLPDAVRFPIHGEAKHLLRASFKKELSTTVLNRPKTGFSLPIERWMVGELRPLCEINIGYLSESGMVDSDGVHSIWKEFLRQPNKRSWSRAFALVVLGDYIHKLSQVSTLSHPIPIAS